MVGLGAAVDYMLELGIERIWVRIQHLADYLRNALSGISGVVVHDLGEVKCGIVSFVTPIEVQTLKAKLHKAGFNISIIHPSHTLLDMQQRDLGHMIRASVHYYNTEEEIDKFVAALMFYSN